MSLNTLADYTWLNIVADVTQAVEKGYVNDPTDKGGETNWGITAALAAQYKAQLVAQFHWDGTMRNLSLDMAYWLYKTHFWDKMLLDQVLAIHPLIAYQLFNVGINTGKAPAISMLQDYLNIMNLQGAYWPDMVVDGGMGPTTISCLQAYVTKRGNEGIQRLMTGLVCFQGAYYRDISKKDQTQEKFSYGWLGRATAAIGHYAKLLGFAI